jgi:hypothetical protein
LNFGRGKITETRPLEVTTTGITPPRVPGREITLGAVPALSNDSRVRRHREGVTPSDCPRAKKRRVGRRTPPATRPATLLVAPPGAPPEERRPATRRPESTFSVARPRMAALSAGATHPSTVPPLPQETRARAIRMASGAACDSAEQTMPQTASASSCDLHDCSIFYILIQ